MLEIQTEQARLDELNRCRDRSWESIEDVYRLAPTNAVNGGELDVAEPARVIEGDGPPIQFGGLLHIGQRVFLSDGHFIGLTTKLFVSSNRQISYLSIRTGHFFGRHKMVPIALVSDVTSLGIQLSINHGQFEELLEYQADSSITEKVDHALWNDEVLRNTDYRGIEVQVRDGVVTLDGYIGSSNHQWRVETAVESIPGVLGLKSHLIADDKLLLQVVHVLIKIERIEGSHVFTKVQNGAVELSGKVVSPDTRNLAEQCAASVPRVRGVINNITIPGMLLEPEDQRFLQPVIGEEIFFRDGPSGYARQVVINQNNRRVVALIIQGQFPEVKVKFGSVKAGESMTPDRFAVIPVRVIRYLTRNSGFLLIDSTDTTQYQNFDPACYVTPDANWIPPYPYCADQVRVLANGGTLI